MREEEPVKILVLGGDGFCGWPASLHLSSLGHEVVIVDNFSRRRIDEELGAQSLTPIRSSAQRREAWHEVSGRRIRLAVIDIASQYERLLALLREERPQVIDLTQSQRATIDAVLRHYGNHGGKYLSGVTHGEKPWRQARQGLAADEPGSTPIDPATMMREYSTQAAQGRGPTRRATFTVADHDHADLLHRGARISRQWSRAMALLAR